jgi:hypothetical protein
VPEKVPTKVVSDCRFLKDDDERLICFNRFVERPTQWHQRRRLPRRNRSSRQQSYRVRGLQVRPRGDQKGRPATDLSWRP